MRTREDILAAFRDLVLERGYDGTTVGDIVERANVGRSTFYDHFEGKDDLFKQSVAPLLAILANTIGAPQSSRDLQLAIAHFWDNRRVSLAMLSSTKPRHMPRFLAEAIEERLGAVVSGKSGKAAIPLNLVAAHLADAQLGLIESWLRCKTSFSAEALAGALHASTNASVRALLPGLR
jgi:AcrR family transcriptional regulator